MKLSIVEFFKFVKLHLLYLKISLKHFAAYKMSAFLTVIFSLFFLIAEILTVDVYYKFSDYIGDWDQNSFYILLGTFNISTCLYMYFFEIAHDEFVFKIRYGELDADLIKPMDSQILTSFQRVDYAELIQFTTPDLACLSRRSWTQSSADFSRHILLPHHFSPRNFDYLFN